MSMKEVPILDYGFVISPELAKCIVKAFLLRAQGIKPGDPKADSFDFEKEVGDYCVVDLVGDVLGEENIQHVSSFTGYAKMPDEIGEYLAEDEEHFGYAPEDYDDDTLIWVPLWNTPTLFQQAYANPAEIENEIKNHLESVWDYFPSDFNILENVRRIIGTMYC